VQSSFRSSSRIGESLAVYLNACRPLAPTTAGNMLRVACHVEQKNGTTCSGERGRASALAPLAGGFFSWLAIPSALAQPVPPRAFFAVGNTFGARSGKCHPVARSARGTRAFFRVGSIFGVAQPGTPVDARMPKLFLIPRERRMDTVNPLRATDLSPCYVRGGTLSATVAAGHDVTGDAGTAAACAAA